MSIIRKIDYTPFAIYLFAANFNILDLGCGGHRRKESE
jgi:hypothetical protein